MHPRKFYIKRTVIAVCLLLLTWYSFTGRINYMRTGSCTGPVTPDTIYRAKTVLKTIPCSDPRTQLIGFEVHTKHIKHAGAMRTEYNVVLRNLDPRVDTYKTYCHDIIADLAATTGEDEPLTINVFDSFEAYCFYNDASPFKYDMEALLPQHMVAIYERGRRWDDELYRTLTFYPYSEGDLRQTMSYLL